VNIEQLITEARERQIEETNAYRAEQEDRAFQVAESFRQRFITAFGQELYTTLGAWVPVEFDAPTRLLFAYQGRDYSFRYVLFEGSHEWRLTRLDPRADGDERRLPSTTLTVYRGEERRNILSFALALSELDQEPNVPHQAPRMIQPPAPVVSEQGAALLEALRIFLQSEI